jgi:hypothetical protein
MINEINVLRQELQDLMELQKGIMVNEKSKRTINMNNTNEQINLSVLQHMENFIVIDNKIIIVDNEKNLYHLKRCKKYEQFIKENGYTSNEEAFTAYIEQHQQREKDLSQEVVDSILENEQEVVKIEEAHNINEKKDFTDFNLSDSS